MAPEKAPAFQFYPKDFISDERVRLMSYTERGIYIWLLSHCWLEGSLPPSVDHIAKLLELPAVRFRKMWEGPIGQCFQAGEDGRWRQKRLEQERTKQENFRRRQSDKGKASAAARQPESNHGSTAVQPRPVQPEGNSSSSVSYLQSSSSKQPSAVMPPRKLAGPPLAGYQKLRLWPWMIEEMIGTLGDHCADFDLDGFLLALDQGDRIIPETWPFVKTEVVAECRRRGYPMAEASTVPTNKRIAGLVAGGDRFLRGEA